MLKATSQNKPIPTRRRNRPAAKPAPQTVRMQFPGSDQEYVCAFVDGPRSFPGHARRSRRTRTTIDSAVRD
jgi:hypothetical protein